MNLQETFTIVRAEKAIDINNPIILTTQFGDALIEQHTETLFSATIGAITVTAGDLHNALIALGAAMRNHNLVCLTRNKNLADNRLNIERENY